MLTKHDSNQPSFAERQLTLINKFSEANKLAEILYQTDISLADNVKITKKKSNRFLSNESLFKPLLRLDLIEDTESLLAFLKNEHAELDRLLAQEPPSNDNQIKKLIFLKRRCIYFICNLEFNLTDHLHRIRGFSKLINTTLKEHYERLAGHALNGWLNFTENASFIESTVDTAFDLHYTASGLVKCRLVLLEHEAADARFSRPINKLVHEAQKGLNSSSVLMQRAISRAEAENNLSFVFQLSMKQAYLLAHNFLPLYSLNKMSSQDALAFMTQVQTLETIYQKAKIFFDAMPAKEKENLANQHLFIEASYATYAILDRAQRLIDEDSYSYIEHALVAARNIPPMMQLFFQSHNKYHDFFAVLNNRIPLIQTTLEKKKSALDETREKQALEREEKEQQSAEHASALISELATRTKKKKKRAHAHEKLIAKPEENQPAKQPQDAAQVPAELIDEETPFASVIDPLMHATRKPKNILIKLDLPYLLKKQVAAENTGVPSDILEAHYNLADYYRIKAKKALEKSHANLESANYFLELSNHHVTYLSQFFEALGSAEQSPLMKTIKEWTGIIFSEIDQTLKQLHAKKLLLIEEIDVIQEKRATARISAVERTQHDPQALHELINRGPSQQTLRLNYLQAKLKRINQISYVMESICSTFSQLTGLPQPNMPHPNVKTNQEWITPEISKKKKPSKTQS